VIRDKHGNWYTVVKAHKRHYCTNRYGPCERVIEPGSLYLRHVAFPGDVVEVLTVMHECMTCARAAGRDLATQVTP